MRILLGIANSEGLCALHALQSVPVSSPAFSALSFILNRREERPQKSTTQGKVLYSVLL
jgi:hypothetical protein